MVINKTYTEPAEAEEFVKRTHVDSLAVGIGNSHGFYKGKPELRFDILEETNKRVTIPVVLHGASGIPEEDMKKAIEIGIAKVNFATELRDAFSKAVKNYFQKDIDCHYSNGNYYHHFSCCSFKDLLWALYLCCRQ